MATVNVTVGMTPEMLAKIDSHTEEFDMSRAEWIRHCIRQAEDSPFECPENSIAETTAEVDTDEGAA